MAAPIWVTAKGSLGTIEEQQFYQLEMQAYDPDGGDITYNLVAGQLPPGLVMYENGVIQGQPKELYYIRGVPFDVKQDVTSTWCCRATSSSTGQITDRTFSITVTGQDEPEITTPPSELGRFLDGTYAEIQLDAIDLDGEPIAWQIREGELPPGLTLDASTGLISGYIRPAEEYEIANRVGWSTEVSWDEAPWDFGSKAINFAYQFTVQVTDGKSYDASTYTIFVYSHDNLTADNDILTADHSLIVTADADVKRNPVLLTRSRDLGTYAHDNYFAYKFEGLDFDGDAISFSLLVGEGLGFDNEVSGFDSTLLDFGDFELPPGLTLSTETGWLHGQIPRVVAGQTEYTFAVRVYKRNYPDYQSRLTFFTVTIINDLSRLITWTTSSNLGTMKAGDVSEKYVAARNESNVVLFYTVSSGRLPQGLRLNQDGLIIGRTSFEVGSFDKGTTTFDINSRDQGFALNETTFDRSATFTVKASDGAGEIVAYRTFTITVIPRQYDPYESLYLRAQPGTQDKSLISAIFNNTDIIPNNDLYRSSDPYFGRSKDLRLLLLSGINASTFDEYMQAMVTNHYRKALKIGDYSWAQALNDDGTVAYEVVYLPIIDDLSIANNSTITQATDIENFVTVPESIDLESDLSGYTAADVELLTQISDLALVENSNRLRVYPNSLNNMRRAIHNALGQPGQEPLPRWMTSKQSNGRALGWVPAVPVAYVKPGAGAKVVFNLNRRAFGDIKEISFDLDRYIWDMNLSKFYDASSNTYLESVPTTFDAEAQPLNEPVVTVDYAVSVPFSYLNGSTYDFIDDVLGGLDGVIDSYVGRRIIFAQQENYSGFVGEEDGWIRYGSLWDSESGWDDGISGWDDYEIIPGYVDTFDGSTLNQRAAVWIFTLGNDGELLLEVNEYVDLGDSVAVTNGAQFGGKILRYGPLIFFSQNETVPRYNYAEDQMDDQETTFDNRATRFISNVSVYQDPDEGDKYLAFPRTNIWV